MRNFASAKFWVLHEALPAKVRTLVGLVMLATLFASSAGALDLQFSADNSEYAESAAAYRAIWVGEGAAIHAALLDHACSEFPISTLAVTVAEAPSYSGDSNTPMRLRASYPDAVKRGMLVHELAHWLVPPRFAERIGLSVHQALNLILPQVWEDLWGPEFVQDQIAFESQLSESYRADWEWALALTPEERRAKWMAFLEVAGRVAACPS